MEDNIFYFLGTCLEMAITQMKTQIHQQMAVPNWKIHKAGLNKDLILLTTIEEITTEDTYGVMGVLHQGLREKSLRTGTLKCKTWKVKSNYQMDSIKSDPRILMFCSRKTTMHTGNY